jgi:hypothetical protein
MVRVTKNMSKSSATLTRCSTKSGPEYMAHFERKKDQSSVSRENDRRDIISDTYALKRTGGAISFQTFPA